MKKNRSTKRALLMSALSMVLCLSMLVGSTFAWFTDSVTSSGNKIQAGTLDVDLYMWTAADASTEITEAKQPIFGTAGLAQDSLNTLWEPGKTQVAYLSIKNNGSLALKYKVNVLVKNPAGGKDLYKVMQYAIIPDAQYDSVAAWNSADAENVVLGLNETQSAAVSMDPGAEHFFALAIHMDEAAGNEYQGGSVEFDIIVSATQLTSELDSFGPNYDADSTYPASATGTAPIEAGTSSTYVKAEENSSMLAAFNIPAAAIAEGATSVTVSAIKQDTPYEGIVVATGETLVTYDVSVSNLKEGNTEPIKCELRGPGGLDPATVKVYHYGTEIDSTYDPVDGIVTFHSATFSPFTVVYEADSEYIPPVVDQSKLPKANVVEAPEHVGVSLPWGSYGQWSPDTTVDADPKLEAAYTFSCTETLEEAKNNPYANWYCDFYVMLDEDLGENQIFLGGNYGSFGWVGFHNGDVTLDANTEIGLLESVTNSPWTYLDVVQNVGTFICGVGDVNDALADAKFTVMLRLTNPENPDDFYNVATINHTFTKVVNSGDELQDAINNGSENIEMGGDIDLNDMNGFFGN